MSASIPPEVVLLFIVLPFLIGAAAGPVAARWGWPALVIAGLVVLIPSAVSIFIVPNQTGLAAMLAIVTATPSLLGVFLSLLARKWLASRRHEG